MSHNAIKKSDKAARSRRAQRAHAQPSIVVVELGALFPAWVSARAFSGEFRVIAQRESEALDAFRARFLELVQRLAAEGTAVDTGVFVCNERTDDSAVAVRQMLARDLIASSAPGNEPRLVLAAAARSSSRLRQALQALAPCLAGERGPRASVRIDEELASRPHSSLAAVANVA
jgi:hypothetical protein